MSWIISISAYAQHEQITLISKHVITSPRPMLRNTHTPILPF